MLILKGAGVLGVDVVIHPIIEKIQLESVPFLLKSVTPFKVVGRLHVEVRITDLKGLHGIVGPMDIKLLGLRSPLRLGKRYAEMMRFFQCP